MRNLINLFIGGGFLFGSMVAFFFWAIYSAAAIPVVYFSYSNGDCTKVESMDSEYSCDDIPKKYEHRWVR